MCEPTTIAYAVVAITAASQYVQYQDNKKSAKEQEEMIQDGLAKERAATARQYEEINQVSQDASAERHRDYLIESARLKAIGAESGLGGVTQDRVEQDAQNAADTDISTLEANRGRQSGQAAIQSVAKNSQARVQMAGIRRPSALGSGLQIAGTAASTYSTYKSGGYGKTT